MTELCEERKDFGVSKWKILQRSYFDEWSPAALRANISPVCAVMNYKPEDERRMFALAD